MASVFAVIKVSTILVFAVLLAVDCRNIEQLSTEECSDLGFNDGVVQCTDCESLRAASGSEPLWQECLRCCAEKVEEKYELVVLQLDSRYTSRLPNMAEILKVADSLNVMVRNKAGARPSLLMYKDRLDDLPSAELNVFSWTIDTFKEFVEDHLIK